MRRSLICLFLFGTLGISKHDNSRVESTSLQTIYPITISTMACETYAIANVSNNALSSDCLHHRYQQCYRFAIYEHLFWMIECLITWIKVSVVRQSKSKCHIKHIWSVHCPSYFKLQILVYYLYATSSKPFDRDAVPSIYMRTLSIEQYKHKDLQLG